MEYIEDKLNDIKIDKEALYQRLRELDEEEFKLKNQGVLEKLNPCLGKFYKAKVDPMLKEIELFVPKKVEFINGHVLNVVGLYVRGNTFAPGDKAAYIETQNSMGALDFLDNYEEIEEEAFKSMMADILDIID